MSDGLFFVPDDGTSTLPFTPINMQAINSMTQDKMNSLKDADGKIPSLANQIIMTDEEDANLGYKLYAHHLYLVSSNTRIWVTITTETEDVFTQSTFHKWLYDKGFNGTTTNTSGNWLSVNGGFRSEKTNISAIASNNSTSGDFVVIATTSSGTTPTAITVTEFSDMVKLINPQPAMIYTGAELHEGEGISIKDGVISTKGYTAGSGISIDNGVISRAITKKQLTGSSYNCKSANIPIALSTILQYDFISIDIMGRSGGGSDLGREIRLIPVSSIIQNPSGNVGNNLTYYNQRYALLGVIHLKFNTSEIVTQAIFASPYNTTNLEAVANDNVFVGNVWGYKL